MCSIALNTKLLRDDVSNTVEKPGRFVFLTMVMFVDDLFSRVASPRDP